MLRLWKWLFYQTTWQLELAFGPGKSEAKVVPRPPASHQVNCSAAYLAPEPDGTVTKISEFPFTGTTAR